MQDVKSNYKTKFLENLAWTDRKVIEDREDMEAQRAQKWWEKAEWEWLFKEHLEYEARIAGRVFEEDETKKKSEV